MIDLLASLRNTPGIRVTGTLTVDVEQIAERFTSAANEHIIDRAAAGLMPDGSSVPRRLLRLMQWRADNGADLQADPPLLHQDTDRQVRATIDAPTVKAALRTALGGARG